MNLKRPGYIPRTIVLLLVTAIVSSQASSASEEKIAIVGAGFSGLSAAHHLTRKGYTDITIFDSNFRVGGFASSLKYKNVTHDLATYAMTELYWRFRETMEEMGAEFCAFDGYFIIPRSGTAPSRTMDRSAFFAALSTSILDDPSTFTKRFTQQFQRYTQLWSELYEVPYITADLKTEFLFPPKPPSNYTKLQMLATPMTDFLRQQGLDLLIPLFRIRSNPQAYGPIDSTPALYVMSWNHPIVLLPTSKNLVPCGKYGSFQALANLLTENLGNNVTIRFGRDVRGVVRGNSSAVVLIDGAQLQQFDKVIITTKLPEKCSDSFMVLPVTMAERNITKAVESTGIYCALFEGPRDTVIGADRFIQFDGNSVSKSGIHELFFGTLTQETRYPGTPRHSDPKTIAREAALYYSSKQTEISLLSAAEKEKTILARLRTWDDTPWKVVRGFHFTRYFQRWNRAGVLRLHPWAMQSLQGFGNVYFLSAHVCGMESVGHLFDCAKHLVDDHF